MNESHSSETGLSVDELLAEMKEHETAEDLLRWARRLRGHFDARFYNYWDTVRQYALNVGDDNAAENVETTVMMIRTAAEKIWEPDFQDSLLTIILDSDSDAKLRENAHNSVLYITDDFFTELGRFADHSTQYSDAAIGICENLLDAIEFNDLRSDWDDPERTIIWGAVFFLNRDLDLRDVVGDEGTPTPLDYVRWSAFLRLSLPELFERDMARFALGWCNVLLGVAHRFVDVATSDSRADGMRLDLLVTAARLVRARAKTSPIGGMVNARRLLEEADQVYSRLDRQPLDESRRIAVDVLAAEVLDLRGSMAKDDDQYDQADELLQLSVQICRSVLERTPHETDGLYKLFTNRAETSLASSLGVLGITAMRGWRLDESRAFFEEAIARLRAAGTQGPSLALPVQWLAQLEFIATNFTRAEALLAEAADIGRAGRNHD